MGIKPTRDQCDERIDRTRELLATHKHTWQIKAALRDEFGVVSARTCADYIARARRVMFRDMGTNKEESRAQAIERYEAIAQDPASSPMERIRAQERIDKILGLECPQRTELSGINGKPIAVENTNEQELEKLPTDRLLHILGAVTNANGHTNGNGKANGGNGHHQGAGSPSAN